MATVYIPSLLRDLTSGREVLNVTGASVGEILENLEAMAPGLRDRLCDGECLRSGLAVAVDGQLATQGLSQPVAISSEVHFLPALAGGGR